MGWAVGPAVADVGVAVVVVTAELVVVVKAAEEVVEGSVGVEPLEHAATSPTPVTRVARLAPNRH